MLLLLLTLQGAEQTEGAGGGNHGTEFRRSSCFCYFVAVVFVAVVVVVVLLLLLLLFLVGYVVVAGKQAGRRKYLADNLVRSPYGIPLASNQLRESIGWVGGWVWVGGFGMHSSALH